MKSSLKKALLLVALIVSLSCQNVWSQGDTLIIQGDSVLSGDFSDWDYYETIKVIKYKSNAQPTRLFAELYDDENFRVMVTDSITRLDSTSGYDTLLVDDFCDFEHIGFEYPFANTLEQRFVLQSGQYTLKFIMYDTNYDILDTAIKNISIDNSWPSQMVGFWDSKEIYSRYLDTMTYQWIHPDTPTTPYFYKFMIHELLNNYNSEYEFYVFDSVPVYDSLLYGIRQHNIDTLQFKFEVGKKYLISVLTAKDSLFNDRLVVNDGLSVPFMVKSSGNPVKSRGGEDICTLLNNGFEDGTLNGWEIVGASNIQGPDATKPEELTPFTPGIIDPEVSVVSSTDNDPNVPLNCVPFGGGNKACKLGDNKAAPGTNMFGITKTFTVTSNTLQIPYSYAVVLQDQHSSRILQPFYHATASAKRRRRRGGSTTIVHDKLVVAKTGDPVFTATTNGDYNYRIWDCESIDLSKFKNRTVTISFIASDCLLKGHPGRAYVDFCVNNGPTMDFTMNSTYCMSSNISLDGSSSLGAVSWNWSIVKSNPDGTMNYGETFTSDLFFGTNSKVFDLSGFINSQSFQLECNSYYEVSLIGFTNCGTFHKKQKVFFIECPGYGLAGSDKCCPNATCNIQLGVSPISGFTYSWSPSSCLSSSTIANPYFSSPCPPNTPTFWPHTLTLTVTSTSGCVGSDEVKIYKSAPTNLSILVSAYKTCTDKFTLSGTDLGGSNIWRDQNGNVVGEGIEILLNKDAVDRVITVTSTNPCGQTSTSVFAPKNTLLNGSIPAMFYPTAMHPKISPYYGALPIWESGKSHGTANSYNAYEYTFLVYDWWGGKVYEKTESNGPWNNGDVWWDGKANGASDYVPNGKYVWKLGFRNCTYTGTAVWNWPHQVLRPDPTGGRQWKILCLCYKYKKWHYVYENIDREIVYMTN